MLFRSTKSRYPLITYKEAMLKCLPGDGGLYVPDQVIDFRQILLHMDKNISFNELIAVFAPLLLEGELNQTSVVNAAMNAAFNIYDFQPELIEIDNDLAILNLFNGPTGSFKDFGITFMSAIFEEVFKDGKQTMIISAAKPDTGLSMAHAYAGKKGITLVLLYPSGQVRGLDPSTFIQNGGNIIPIQIKGTFDDCQRLVIDTINDQEFAKRYNVTGASSMNPGRLFPQIFYYLYAFTQIKNKLSGDLVFSVPSGNFGSFIAGLYAWKFGMPVNGFIAAMNANNAIGDFFRGKSFLPKPLINTNSPALDVSVPLNLERLEYFYSESPAVMRNMVFPVSIDDSLTLKTIKYVYDKYNLIIDSHTAVAFAAAQKVNAEKKWTGNSYTVVLATGHPAKYAGLTEQTIGKKVNMPPHLQILQKKCDPIALISPQLDAFENAIASCF